MDYSGKNSQIFLFLSTAFYGVVILPRINDIIVLSRAQNSIKK